MWEYCHRYLLNRWIEATIPLLFGYLATISLSWEVILVVTFFILSHYSFFVLPEEGNRQCVKSVCHFFFFCFRTAVTRKNSLSKFWQDNITINIQHCTNVTSVWRMLKPEWCNSWRIRMRKSCHKKRFENREIMEIFCSWMAFNPFVMRKDIRFHLMSHNFNIGY